VGVIFIIPELDIVEFHYPKKINRLSQAYPSLNEKIIKKYLTSFEKKSRSLNKYISKYSFDFNELLFDQLLVEDSSSLQFDKFRNAIFFDDYKSSINNYVKLILGPYNSPTVGKERKYSDNDVINLITKEIESLNPEKKDLLKFDDKRILKNNFVSFKSDFYWKNTDTHYVKGLSFDLANETNIVEKSILINGQLRQLEKSLLKNSKIDLIIHEPSNSEFIEAFAEASVILLDNQLDKEIIKSNNSNEYTNRILQNIN
jgi:hypothetical protein